MRTKLFMVISVVILASMILAACGTPATTAAPAAPAAGETSAAPAVEPTAAAPAAPAAAEFKSKDPTSWVEVTFGGPDTLDPAYDYETAGGGVLMNVYDTLIWYNKDKPNEFIPQLATEVPSAENGGISADGLTVTFKIRSGVKFHDGTVLTPSDVAFTFQRGLLAGGTSSPQWLFAQPILGVANEDIGALVDANVAAAGTTGAASVVDDPEAMQKVDPAILKASCEAVTTAITADDAAGTVTFKLAQPWGPFLSTFLGGWGSIQSKAWVGANGGWDGSCDTWQKWYAWGPEKLNALKLGTGENGTGPYILDKYSPTEEIDLKANENYWRTDPAWEGGPSGAPALKTVIIKSIDEFNTRLAMFQAGDADQLILGSSSDYPVVDELIGQTCSYDGQCTDGADPTKGFRLINKYVTATRTDAFMTFTVNTDGGNNFIGSGKLDGNGSPANLFSDVHVRRAFAYCFDYDTYLNDVLLGEGVRSKTVMLPGMVGYDENAPYYTYDLDKCKAEFQASKWNEVKSKDKDGNDVVTYEPSDTGTISLWDTGFRMTMAYNTGNTARQTIAQILQTSLSTVNEKFVVEVTGLPWAAFLNTYKAKKLPIFTSGWQMDLFDTHNWVQPYTTGAYGGRQNMPADLKKQFSDIYNKAVVETDNTKRAEIYKQFNQLFYDQVPTLLLHQVEGRHYEPRYVKGWYFNPMYSDLWFYALSKN